MIKLNSFLIAFLLLLASCSSHEVEKPKEGTALSALYDKAMDHMIVEKDYKKAAKAFENVERFYPLSPWAMKAQLMAAYAYYESGQHEQAIANLENFLQSQSNSDYAPYAQYLLGLCYYIQITGVERDQTMTYKALKAFRKVTQKHPKTLYARDARLKIDLCKEHLAGQDMEIGRFYLDKKIPTAALQRFLHVVQSHQTTSHAAEALYRCVEVFLTLGMKDEALKHAAILGYNYPGNKWYQSTYSLLDHHDLIKKHQIHLSQKKVKGASSSET
ncbi:MAG: outer membrane protein assembly factor BamD [Alphaproteobacteria bacterium]|nr:MAG: outer membrane protein assembly factor BamD [Alphaproteobacteria bacterium]